MDGARGHWGAFGTLVECLGGGAGFACRVGGGATFDRDARGVDYGLLVGLFPVACLLFARSAHVWADDVVGVVGGVGVAATSLDLVRGGGAGGNAHPLLFSFYGVRVDAPNLR